MPILARHITRLLALALLAHMALSWRLWAAGAERTFPLVPVWGDAQAVAEPWAAWLGWTTVGIALLAVIFPGNKKLLAFLLGWVLIMITLDINRLQPWTYFYLLAWGVLLSGNIPTAQPAQTALRWLLAAVYAWGGINKLTPYFAEDNFPWFCDAFAWTKPAGALPWAGYAAALLEFLFAPGLLWNRSRPVFRWLVVVFHVFIIASLSPLGLNWNTVVIPWNAAMAGMVWMLYDTQKPAGSRQAGFRFDRPNLARLAILALAWCMPVFNILHQWDEPLSWKMYSNTQTEASFEGKPCPGMERMWQRHAYDDGKKLLLDDWAMEELHVPVYNNKAVFRRIARYLCQCTDQPAPAGLYLFQVQRWDRSAESWEIIPCQQPSR